MARLDLRVALDGGARADGEAAPADKDAARGSDGHDGGGAESASATQTGPSLGRREVGAAVLAKGAEEAAAIDLTHDLDGPWNAAQRYDRRELLGVGGMGEVELHKDRWIGREVARKTLRAGRAEGSAARRRFLREMQVQGQLEHPAIVPVYDAAADADGHIHFTMRRVRGPTLRQILEGLAAGDAAMTARYSRRKLLTAFVSVCLAVHYAHTRGVLHRDLKPSNIMLGEFGEVYVLDWGVAKLLHVTETAPEARLTQEGAIVGTPAYMAPEQLLRRAVLDGRTDVYALGMILYEVLALRPLHQGRDTPQIVETTLGGLDTRPSARTAGVAPELDAICVRATARDPAQRFASVQELADAVEGYLDGDRDLERRRAAASEHAARAAEAAARATAADASEQDAEAGRDEAMREVVKALTFDPAQAAATRTLVELMVKVPERMPAEVELEMQQATDRSRQEVTRYALITFLFWLGFAPAGLLLGIRSGVSYGVSIAIAAIGAAYAWQLLRRKKLPSRDGYVLAFINAVAIASVSSLLGPFVLTPMCATVMTLLSATLAMKRERPVLIAIGAVTVAAPFALELLHVLPPSFVFEGGRMVLLPRGYHLPRGWTLAILLYLSVTWVVIPSLLMGRIRDGFNRAERELFLHAWHFRRLLPPAPREGAASGAGREAASATETA